MQQWKKACAAVVTGAVALTAEAGITTVSPSSATQGATGVPVRFQCEAPPLLPPGGATPTNITIGTINARPGTLAWDGSVATGTFDIPAAEPTGPKDCTVLFSGPSYSGRGMFTVQADAGSPPTITSHPQSTIVQTGDRANFSVTATGAGPFSYQWQSNAVAIAGAESSSYSILSAQDGDEADYRCIVGNAGGSATSGVARLVVTDVLPFPGYNLFSPITETNTWLTDNFGAVVNRWTSRYTPGNSLYLLDDGSLLRTANTGSATFNEGGAAGRIEQYDWDGNLIWAYDCDTAASRSHHDIEVLPNGNILMIVWELKTAAEAGAAGRDPSLLDDGELWPDCVIEVAPTGAYGGEIVWEWHVWDHLVQDFDPGKDNYGSVSNNPQLVDLNFTQSGPNDGIADWNHINAIDYNAELDQIILTVRNFSEIWIIDHSTTTQEAAGHTGGARGKGGDLLYRWGNPRACGCGDAADQQLFVPHDAQWIASGLPGAGNILVFNNGQNRTGGQSYSTVDELVPPVSASGSYTGGLPYAPSAPLWTYAADPPADFFAPRISGAQRLPNGSTLICEGTEGYVFEVTTNGETEVVWDYQDSKELFRFQRYAWDFPGFDGRGLDPGESPELTYAVVDTHQQDCYNDNTTIAPPAPGQAFHGQDAQHNGRQPSYIRGADGKTVYDFHTGLTWTQSPDIDGDGAIDINDKMTQAEAAAYVATLNAAAYGGHDDWRLPSVKEVYSLMDFRGTDPMSDDTSTLIPFIDADFFDFNWGDTNAGERTIDSQLATTSVHLDQVMGGTAMSGLNIVDGRIKGYPVTKDFYVHFCRGNTNYAINRFADNGDGTVSDAATGLMWQRQDSGRGMLWSNALAYVQQLNASTFLGYSDWRLPNAKELQSIVDYSRAPTHSGTAAIDPVFHCTTITNEAGQVDWPWYVTSTTHKRQDGSGSAAAYVCFGRAMGYIANLSQWTDVHGSGAQRSDSKTVDTTGYTYVPNGWYHTHSPQGDAARWYNYVRVVRDSMPAVAPGITITNPATATTLTNVYSIALAGTGERLDGQIAWTNAATGGSGSFAAASNWVSPGIALVQGANALRVSATNAHGAASHSVTVTVVSAVACSVLHVDVNTPSAPGAQDGASWASAFGSLQDALDAVSTNASTLWVAEGVYTNAATVTFTNVEVTILCGFTNGMSTADLRDAAAYPVVLDGRGAEQRVLELQSQRVELDGLVVSNARTTVAIGTAGLKITGATNVVLRRCTVTKCIAFAQNTTFQGFAAHVSGEGAGSVTIDSCTFRDNNTGIDGGADGIGLYVGSVADLWIADSLFDKNVKGSRYNGIQGGGLCVEDVARAGISRSAFQSNGGPPYHGYGSGGALCILGSTAAEISECTFESNSLTLGRSACGGGALAVLDAGSTVTAQRCTFTANSIGSTGRGGAAFVRDGGLTLVSCLLHGNSAELGGAAYLGAGGALVNTTVAGNNADSGGGVYCVGGTLTNCVVYANTAANAADGNVFNGGGAFESTCSTPVLDGAGNTAADPAFADAVNGDYRLNTNSPCVNAGMNALWMGSASDLDGGSRVQGARVDMGAYEAAGDWVPVADTDGDTLNDWEELADYGTDPEDADSDDDGMDDGDEVFAWTSPTNSQSLLAIIGLSHSGSNTLIRWSCAAFREYSIWSSPDLQSNTWSAIATDIPATGSEQEVTVSAVNTTGAYYRVSVQPYEGGDSPSTSSCTRQALELDDVGKAFCVDTHTFISQPNARTRLGQ